MAQHFLITISTVAKILQRELSDNIEEAIMKISKDLTFGDVQSVYRNCMSHLAWVIENSGEYVHESNGIHLLLFTESRNRKGPGTFFTSDGSSHSCVILS
jgi:hypothetical protein